MAKLTQKAIRQAFLNILQHKSLDKITVKDIIEEVEINRNTFYYYYEDIYDLLDDIFEEEVKKVLSEAKDGCTFYEEYVRAASILLDHRQAILHIYNSKSRDILIKYMERVTGAFIRKFVEKAADGYELSQEGIRYITYFYSYALVGNTMHWIADGMQSYREKLLQMVSFSFEATIEDMIKDFVSREN